MTDWDPEIATHGLRACLASGSLGYFVPPFAPHPAIECPATRSSTEGVDDVLGYVLLACATWNTGRSNDCLRWWNNAVQLVQDLGSDSEAPITTEHSSLFAEEEREECRRVFWLVYALDRHFSLCFDQPLRILDS
ncbi:hypothetical protein BJX65DRAFT_312559 [Aspergillus insuetus]